MMSYPPRPPMGMPGMPGMMPQGYGYPPMGMMPMNMGMMPMMPQVPASTVGNTQPGNQPKYSKKFVPQEIPPKSSNQDSKAPVTTVFVGNISERAPDAMIRQMLQRCGNVLSWKRVQGASGKLQAFGFCEYEDPDATLRCIRLLNEWRIAEKNLVVKVDAKTKAQLDEWKKKKWREKNKDVKKEATAAVKEEEREEGEAKESDEDEDEINALDEFTLREDRVAKAGLDAIMREYHGDLSRLPLHGEDHGSGEEKKQKTTKQRQPTDGPKDSSLEDMELDNMTKELINKEIKSFRDAHKDEDPNAEKEREKERELRRRMLEREERDRRERERDRDRDRERDRERERERERERRDRERQRRERTRTRSRSKSRSRDRDQEILDEEELYERRKLERKLREKEAQYQELLTKWEARERKKEREYEKEKEREADRKVEENKEGRRLKEFLEDYDDERDDPKYYKGSALQRRLKEREKEMEADERDRQREKEEIEEIRRKLAEDGDPELEAQIAKLESEKDAHLLPRLNQPPSRDHSRSPSKDHSSRSSSRRNSSASESSSQSASPARSMSSERQSRQHSPTGIIIPGEPHQQQYMEDHSQVSSQSAATNYGPVPPVQQHPNGYDRVPQGVPPVNTRPAQADSPQPPAEGGQKQKRKKLTASEVFNQDDDDVGGPKKKKLVPLDYEDDKKKTKPISLPIQKPQTAEEKRKCIKNLIEKIPTAKEELFAYPLDWSMVDSSLMDRRIMPWVNKKIVEYIGDEELTLTNFICEKVMSHSSPTTILADISMVFDEEAEVFVVKMWRLLIYETEAKKLGLVK